MTHKEIQARKQKLMPMAIQMYFDGMSAGKIAKQLGLTEGAVRKYLQEYGNTTPTAEWCEESGWGERWESTRLFIRKAVGWSV